MVVVSSQGIVEPTWTMPLQSSAMVHLLGPNTGWSRTHGAQAGAREGTCGCNVTSVRMEVYVALHCKHHIQLHNSMNG